MVDATNIQSARAHVAERMREEQPEIEVADLGEASLPPPSTRPRRFPPVTVSDIMTRNVIAASPGDTLENIEQAMVQFRFNHLPVIDDQGKLVGLLTHRDLATISSSSLSADRERRDQLIHTQVRIQQVMKRELVTVMPDTSVHAAGHLMWEHKIGCLPVTTSGGELRGIVTEADYLKLALALLNASPSGPPPATADA